MDSISGSKKSSTKIKVRSEEHSQKQERLKALLGELIQSFIEGTEIACVEIDEGYELVIPQPGRRRQKVYITTDRRDSDGEDIYQIFTVCTEAAPNLFEFALRANMEMDYGAMAIKDIFGQDFLVIVDTQLVRTAQAAEIEKSALALAELGDDIEQILTGEDIR